MSHPVVSCWLAGLTCQDPNLCIIQAVCPVQQVEVRPHTYHTYNSSQQRLRQLVIGSKVRPMLWHYQIGISNAVTAVYLTVESHSPPK
jgi:hypothetical protein